MELAQLILEYVRALVWPVTLILLIFLFRSSIVRLLLNLKTVTLPDGTELDWREGMKLAEEAAEAVESSEKKGHSGKLESKSGYLEFLSEMYRYGFQRSPTDYDWTYYIQLSARDPNLALAGLRMELERMLRNLQRTSAKEYSGSITVGRLIGNLYEEEIITGDERELLDAIVSITNGAVHGQKIATEDAVRVIDWAETFKDLYLSFMRGVIDRLRAENIQPPWPKNNVSE